MQKLFEVLHTRYELSIGWVLLWDRLELNQIRLTLINFIDCWDTWVQTWKAYLLAAELAYWWCARTSLPDFDVTIFVSCGKACSKDIPFDSRDLYSQRIKPLYGTYLRMSQWWSIHDINQDKSPNYENIILRTRSHKMKRSTSHWCPLNIVYHLPVVSTRHVLKCRITKGCCVLALQWKLWIPIYRYSSVQLFVRLEIKSLQLQQIDFGWLI